MSLVRKTITFTKKQASWIKAQIEEGNFANESEYIRSLVRNDLEDNFGIPNLDEKLQEGIDSGVSDKTVNQVWEEAEKRYLEKNAKVLSK